MFEKFGNLIAAAFAGNQNQLSFSGLAGNMRFSNSKCKKTYRQYRNAITGTRDWDKLKQLARDAKSEQSEMGYSRWLRLHYLIINKQSMLSRG